MQEPRTIEGEWREGSSVEFDQWQLMVQSLEEQFAGDSLYKGLTPEDRSVVFTDELKALARGEQISTSKATEMIANCDWMKERNADLNDTMLRNWFHMDIGLEEYIRPIRSGRNRSFTLESVVRLKLLSIYRYVRNCTMQTIADIIYGVEHRIKKQEEALMTQEQLKQFVMGQAESVFGELKEIIELGMAEQSKRLTAIQEGHASLEQRLDKVEEGQQVVQMHLDEVVALRRDRLEFAVKEKLTKEAKLKWEEQPTDMTHLKQFFGFVKVEDVRGRDAFIERYIARHLPAELEKALNAELSGSQQVATSKEIDIEIRPIGGENDGQS